MGEPVEHPNPGEPPKRWPKDTRIGVRWANGTVSRWTHTIAQLRWTHTDSPFDILAFWRE